MREVDLGFAVVVLTLEETALVPEAESEATVEVLAGARAREIGLDFAFSLGLDGGFGSSTAMLVSSSLPPAPPLTFSFSLFLAFPARPTAPSPLASFSEPDTSFNELRGRFRVERDVCD